MKFLFHYKNLIKIVVASLIFAEYYGDSDYNVLIFYVTHTWKFPDFTFHWVCHDIIADW